MYSGHRHDEAQRNSQQVQSHAARFRLHQQGPQGSGKEIHTESSQDNLIKLYKLSIHIKRKRQRNSLNKKNVVSS